MRQFDEMGVFWVEGCESDQLSGRLRFDPSEDGITLTLVGAFERSYSNRDTETIRILGWTGTRMVTLERCFSSGFNHRSPGVAESRYRANEMLLGYHALEPVPEFQSVTVALSCLNDWVGRSGITKKANWDRTTEINGDELTVTLNPLETESETFSRGEVSLSFSWETRGDELHGIEIEHWPAIRISYTEMQPLATIRKDIGRIRDLLTLCSDTPVAIDRFVVRRPDIRVRMLSGEEGPEEQKIDFMAQPLRYSDPSKRRPQHQLKMFLTYSELGGIQAIARWVDTSERFQQVLDSFMSASHAKQMYGENRFLNVTYAAEAFHRITQGGTCMSEEEFQSLLKTYVANTPEEHHEWLLGRIGYGNEPSLPKRLRQLASRSAPATGIIIRNRGRWSYLLAKVRNELTHLGGIRRKFNGEELYFLTESVYSVVRVCMLLECGVDTETLKSKATSENMTWYKPRLEKALQAVREDFENSE